MLELRLRLRLKLVLLYQRMSEELLNRYHTQYHQQ
jgi:hypothetical protein